MESSTLPSLNANSPSSGSPVIPVVLSTPAITIISLGVSRPVGSPPNMGGAEPLKRGGDGVRLLFTPLCRVSSSTSIGGSSTRSSGGIHRGPRMLSVRSVSTSSKSNRKLELAERGALGVRAFLTLRIVLRGGEKPSIPHGVFRGLVGGRRRRRSRIRRARPFRRCRPRSRCRASGHKHLRDRCGAQG